MSTMVIDGKPASARSGATVEIHDPATGERVDTVPQAGVEETRQAIDAAHAAFRGWADTLPQKRTQILMKGAALARQHLDEVASLLTREQGKPLRDSKIEAERFVENIEFYAMLSASGAIRGKHVQLSVPGAYGLVVRRPLGVVGAIIPWNFPLTLLANKIAPALAVGNTVVAKPASSTPLSTIRLVELMNEGGLPPGVLNVVVGPGAVVGQELIKNPKVRKIGFTGETQTGKQVMAEAASDLKHVTREQGDRHRPVLQRRPGVPCGEARVRLRGRRSGTDRQARRPSEEAQSGAGCRSLLADGPNAYRRRPGDDRGTAEGRARSRGAPGGGRPPPARGALRSGLLLRAHHHHGRPQRGTRLARGNLRSPPPDRPGQGPR